MKRRIIGRAFLTLVVGIAAGIVLHWVTAHGHHQGDFFPIPRSSFLLEVRMERETGAWPWTYEQHCATGNLWLDVQGAMLDTERRYGVPHPVWAAGTPGAQRNISTCGAEFTAGCGAGFAVACVGSDPPYYPKNCDAKYDGPYQATFYSFDSRKSVVKHELQHCQTGRAEGYCDVQESAPPCNTGVTCQPSPSIMGCGAQHPYDYSAYDDAAWAVRHYPAGVARFGSGTNGAGGFVYACNVDTIASRLSVLYQDDGGPVYWSGVIRELKPDANGCQGIGVLEGVAFQRGRCVLIKAENLVSWHSHANETKVACS